MNLSRPAARPPLLLPLVLAALAAPPASGQAAPSAEEATLRGRVVDARSGRPLAGARVAWEHARRPALTDTAGRFVFEGLDPEPGIVTVDHYGYGTRVWRARAAAGSDVGDLALEPDPLLLEGVTVVTDRLAEVERMIRNRRNAVPFAVRALDQDRLVSTGARDVADFLTSGAGLHPARCPSRSLGTGCIWRRGRAVEPRVYIDEMPVIGGLEQLASYQTHELYLLEVYAAGSEIRAYTHQFMERMVRRPRRLFPIGIW